MTSDNQTKIEMYLHSVGVADNEIAGIVRHFDRACYAIGVDPDAAADDEYDDE